MHGLSTFRTAHTTSNLFHGNYGNDSMTVFERDAFRIGQGPIRSLTTRTSILLRKLSRVRMTPSSNRMTLWNGKMPTRSEGATMTTWTTPQIRIEAHYISHEPDTLVLASKSVSFIAPEETRKTGADGTVMTSLGPTYLLVKLANGADLNALRAIRWEPNRLLFIDSAGEQHHFPVNLVVTQEPDTAKFVRQT